METKDCLIFTMDFYEYLIILIISALLPNPCQCGYGNVGGPIAKSARKPVASKTRTTAFPDVDIGDPGIQGANANINVELVKQNSTVPPSAVDKPQMFKATPGEYSDMCCWEPYKGQILKDITDGRAGKPFYGYVATESCSDVATCLNKCRKETCNYVIFTSSNTTGTSYAVHRQKLSDLSTGNFSNSQSSDSYVRRCLREYDITPGCTELVATSCPLCDEFFDFIAKYNKSYKGCEFIRRFEIFKLNKLKIIQMNNDRVLEEDASFAINHFADYTHEEFVKLFTGALPPEKPTRWKRDTATLPPGLKPMKDPVLNATGAQTLQLRHNWADYGVIPPVRDQLDCGSCYAFTSTDLVAAQYAIDHGIKQAFTLAPQYILNCLTPPAAYGCDGGRPMLVMQQLSQCVNSSDENACMFPLETCMPYMNEASKTCGKPKECPGAPKIQVQQYNMVQTNDFLEKQKMAGLLTRGPLIVQIDASDQWQFYQEGILRAYQCTNKTNHAVLMTGYDYGSSLPAYIIRNTWGDEWGQKGYIYIESGVNCCGCGQTVTYACTDKCDVNEGFGKIPLPSPQPPPPTPPNTAATIPPAPVYPGQPSFPPCAGGACGGGGTAAPQPALTYSAAPLPVIPERPYGQPPVRPPPIEYIAPPATLPPAPSLAGVRLVSASNFDQADIGGVRPLSTSTGCPISVLPASVLAELVSGANPSSPDIVLKFTDTCRISECGKICEKAMCNYFVRSSASGLTNFYTVNPEKLKSPTMVDSATLDSFTPQCSNRHNQWRLQRLTAHK